MSRDDEVGALFLRDGQILQKEPGRSGPARNSTDRPAGREFGPKHDPGCTIRDVAGRVPKVRPGSCPMMDLADGTSGTPEIRLTDPTKHFACRAATPARPPRVPIVSIALFIAWRLGAFRPARASLAVEDAPAA